VDAHTVQWKTERGKAAPQFFLWRGGKLARVRRGKSFAGSDGSQTVTQTNRRSKPQDIFIRAAWMVVALACVCGPLRAAGAEKGKAPKAAGAAAASDLSPAGNGVNCRIIYLGFQGALELANNNSSGVIQIRDTLQRKEFPDVCARAYSPYVWMDGRDWLLKHFPSHAGVLTPVELENSPKVILVGHSMGGWAVMSVARELGRRGIPVELTIQVDSVGITDYTLPRNVKAAAIFHARDALMLLTTKHLRREDPSRTELVADVTVEGVGHKSITRDPRIRELVMKMVTSLRAGFAVEAAPEGIRSAPGDTRSAVQR
jgi:hypothetical protein